MVHVFKRTETRFSPNSRPTWGGRADAGIRRAAIRTPFFALCLLIGFLAPVTMIAQISGGVFRGEVRDASDAVVRHAKILIRSVESGEEVIAESNGEGIYSAPTLVPGSYTLTATKDGFKETVFGPVTLQVDQIVRIDFLLVVGASSDSIQVEASGEQLLSTESADVSQVIVSKEVSEIPLNGRQWQQLITLSAGVNPGRRAKAARPTPLMWTASARKQTCIWSTASRLPPRHRDVATVLTFLSRPCANSPSRRELTPLSLEMSREASSTCSRSPARTNYVVPFLNFSEMTR